MADDEEIRDEERKGDHPSIWSLLAVGKRRMHDRLMMDLLALMVNALSFKLLGTPR